MWISTTRLSALEGVTSQTVRRWIKQGKYKTKTTEGGHFRIEYKNEKETILYARVSSAKQKSSILTQKRLLKERYPDATFKYDIGSGFNFKRRNFVRVLERAMQGDSIKLVVTTSDRISRSGLTFIVKVIEFYGGEVEFLEESHKPENFDTATLIAFLTSYCNSQSGKRNSKRHEKDKSVSIK